MPGRLRQAGAFAGPSGHKWSRFSRAGVAVSGDRVSRFRDSGAKFPAPVLGPVFGDPVDMIMKGGPKTGAVFWPQNWGQKK